MLKSENIKLMWEYVKSTFAIQADEICHYRPEEEANIEKNLSITIIYIHRLEIQQRTFSLLQSPDHCLIEGPVQGICRRDSHVLKQWSWVSNWHSDDCKDDWLVISSAIEFWKAKAWQQLSEKLNHSDMEVIQETRHLIKY